MWPTPPFAKGHAGFSKIDYELLIMDVREGTSGTSADVPGCWSWGGVVKDESKYYILPKILRVEKKNIDKKMIRD